MKRFASFILFFLQLFYLHSLWALSEPDLRCLQVNGDGSVLLTWMTPVDISDFKQYDIFYSYDNSNFILAGTDASMINNYLHAINANAQPTIYYYVEAISNSGAKYESRTLSTIDIELSNLGFGKAQLKWTQPTNPLLLSYGDDYHIEVKRYMDSDFSTRAKIQNQQLSYFDIIDNICEGHIDYRISLEDVEAGCFNISRSQGGIFRDETSPEKPNLDSVSVNFTTGFTHLGWKTPPSTDVMAYMIYFYNVSQGWLAVDTVFGNQNTSWIDKVNMSGSGSGQYRVAAMDSCNNSSPMTDFQQTMILSGVLDECEGSMALSWNGYQNMTDGVMGYNIYYTLNGGHLQFVATTSNTNYTYYNILSASHYKFVVQAVNSSGMITASSKPFEFNSDEAASEYQLYFRYASVLDNRSIALRIFTNGDTLPFSKIEVYRSTSRTSNFSLLTEFLYDGTTDYQFVDADVDVAHTIYYYYAKIFNICDNPSKISNTVHNILLTGEAFGTRENRIQWATPEGWENGVDRFMIERRKQIDTIFEHLDTQYPTSNNDYRDDVEVLYEAGSEFLYKVTAIEQLNSYGFADGSTSNTVVLKQFPNTYIANAFVAGKTDFKPANTFVTTENYLFAIYSRAGQMIFKTNNPYEGWDGNMNGAPANVGVYTYLLYYTLPDGTPYEKYGSVTLLR